MPECFVIMPLTTPPEAVEHYRGDEDHFTHVLDCLLVPAIKEAGFAPKKPIAEGSELIHAEIVRNLETADLVLCDCSGLNANVFFELGIRTALARTVCLVKDDRTRLPFDINSINCHTYSAGMEFYDLGDEVSRLSAHIKAAARDGVQHNALWEYFGLTRRGVVTEATQSMGLESLREEIRALGRKIPIPAGEYDGPVVAAFRTFMDDVLAALRPTPVQILNVTRHRYVVMILVDVLPEASVLSTLDGRATRWGFELEIVQDDPPVVPTN